MISDPGEKDTNDWFDPKTVCAGQAAKNVLDKTIHKPIPSQTLESISRRRKANCHHAAKARHSLTTHHIYNNTKSYEKNAASWYK